MAVYTHLGAQRLAGLIAHYDVGQLISAKGIAEGVSNSNWLIETTRDRFILTMYERRIETQDLPFFLGLLDHLSARDCPVPRTIHDRHGAAWRTIEGKAVALIEFLPGVSLDHPDAAQARSVGQALAMMHLASADFAQSRTNDLRPADWRKLFETCGREALADIDWRLPGIVADHLPELEANWPEQLPRSIIHSDLFPDNVLMRGDRVTGLIDFYFACEEITAYDLAVTHAAWCFDRTGRQVDTGISSALIQGYESVRPLRNDERAALPALCRGACLRFMATRAFDWIDTPADALVTRKDPMDFARRLEYYAEAGEALFAPALRQGNTQS